MRLTDEQIAAGEDIVTKAMEDPDFADKATKNPFLFAKVVMGNDPVFPEELTVAEAGDWVRLFNFVFKFGAPGGIQRGVVNSPRNSLKTTLLVSRCAYWIAHDRNIRILYTTNVHENAMNFSRRLQQELESNILLKHCYGSFIPEGEGLDVWRQDYFTVSGRTSKAREPTFTASSLGKTKVGMHYDIIIFDDCVDQKNSQTAEGLRGAIRWFALATALVDQKSKYGPGGCILDVGTRYADGDLHGWLLGEVHDEDSPSNLYTPLVLRSMEHPNWDTKEKRWISPQLNFPHILTEEKLATARSHGAFHFSTQYQNECITPEDATFRPEWFRLVPPYDLPRDLKYYVLTDFAFGLDDVNDRTAIWVVGLDYERKAWCVDFDVGRWALHERCERVINMIKKYDAEAVAIEDIVSNESVKATILRLKDAHKIRFRIVEIGGRSTESKKRRIQSLQPRFEQDNPPHIVFVMRDEYDQVGIKSKFLRRSKKGVLEGEIAEEFLRFPRAIHDDIPDSLSDLDKMDPKYNQFYFAGSSHRVAGPQMLGPSVMNGKVVASRFGINPIPVQEQPRRQEGMRDFYKRHAARMRRANRFG